LIPGLRRINSVLWRHLLLRYNSRPTNPCWKRLMILELVRLWRFYIDLSGLGRIHRLRLRLRLWILLERWSWIAFLSTAVPDYGSHNSHTYY